MRTSTNHSSQAARRTCLFAGMMPKQKNEVVHICKDFGWNSIDIGGIEFSHYLEALAMIWIITAFAGGHWNQAFKLMRK